MSNKNQKSVSLTHGGYHVRVVLDRKGIAYPIWGGAIPVDPIRAFFGGVKIKDQSGRLPSADVRKKFFAAFRDAAIKLGAKGMATI